MANESVPIRDGEGNLRQIAVDTIAGDDWQYTKVAFGAADAATPVSAADPLPVSIDAAALAALENITVTVGSSVEISNDSGNAVPVSAASLPLPSGAATSAKQDSLAALVGEVQASPTANTVLDRLKAIGLLLPSALSSDRLKTESVGNVAHDGVDSGNPVKIGGKANSSAPSSVAAGDRVDAWYTLGGAAKVVVTDDSGNPIAAAGINADGAAQSTSFPVRANGFMFGGGTSWDRQRNNHEITLLASAARTTTNTGSDQTNYNARLAYIVIDITVGSGFGLTPAIQGKDSLSGKYYALSAAITKLTTTGTYVYYFATGTPVAAGGVTAVSGFALPRLWRLVMTADDATSATYSASVNFIN